MKNIYIRKIREKSNLLLSRAEHLLEQQAVSHQVDQLNWDSFQYCPKINFRIAHTGDEIWLKYYVNEKYILAKETNINGKVYKDSCVEFFISADGNNYYNFEINCIGIVHLAYGPGRHNRKFADTEIVKKIETKSTLGNQPFNEKKGDFEWELMVRIPIEAMQYTNLKTFNAFKTTANFYKCGDDCSEPHYVTWNPVNTDTPDYHRPEYFGNAQFE